MRIKHLFSLVLSVIFFATAAQAAYAVPVRTYGGVTPDAGIYTLKAENGGLGNLAPNSSATVDSYLFQCRASGSDACSTSHNSDATLVNKWQNYVTVPQLGSSATQVKHAIGPLPYGQCGRIQYDQGINGIDGAIGGWVYDFGRDCSNTIAQNATCSSQQPINTQFRLTGNGGWISGNDMNGVNLRTGQQIDVNCFAKNGSALLEGGAIDVTSPDGRTNRLANSSELRAMNLLQTGTYTFTCSSTTIASCSDTDSFRVNAVGTTTPSPYPTPAASPTPNPTPNPTPTPNATPNPQVSTCDSLQVVGGNNSLVPAKVTLRARGSDNKGNIQAYRYYFGDGTRVETTDAEITHEYNMSGTFIARVDVKDSVGNYKSSNSCEAAVYVTPSSVESHKNGCSDVFVTADNGAKAPSTVKFTITGYDNKGNIQGYKLDFGNGIVKESDGRTFEQRYDKTGTYPIRAYVKNSSGEWVGGSESCSRNVTIGSTKPLYQQPSTGTPAALPLFGLGSGAVGVVLEVSRRKLRGS